MGFGDNFKGIAVAVVTAGFVLAQRGARTTAPASRPPVSVIPEATPVAAGDEDDEPVVHRKSRRTSVAGESLKPEDFSSVAKVVHPKSPEVKVRLSQLVSKLLLFRTLDQHQVAEIVDAMREVAVRAGDNIIKQGDEGDNFYVVDTGRFEVYVGDKKVTEVGPGGGFGELSLLYGQPRAATVTAATDAIVWSVDRLTFRRIVMAFTFKKRKEHDTFLKDVPILQSLDAAERAKAVDALQPIKYPAGAAITKQGDQGDLFFIVEEGEVVVKKTDKNGNEAELARKIRGDYFGEIALLTDGVRVASVYAVTDVTCLVLDKASFTRLLGPCEDILKRNMTNYNLYLNQQA